MTLPRRVRGRRLRRTAPWRELVRETTLSTSDVVYPLFVVEGGDVKKPIASMPGVHQWSPDRVVEEARSAAERGVGVVLLFGVPDSKTDDARHAYDANGVVAHAVRRIKAALPDLLVWTDVCLCSYTSHGHCGLVNEHGEILNDSSLEPLARAALVHAQAGADAVAPSDMMDGRVAAIRGRLDEEGHTRVPVISYSAKYASALYGPFRDAADSAPAFGDRRSYQMDPANGREAQAMIDRDLAEGADMVMIKPASAYLDVIREARRRIAAPIAAYQVSGEFGMIKAAAERGWLDERAVALETLVSIKRAGADIIVTYFAKQIGPWLDQS